MQTQIERKCENLMMAKIVKSITAWKFYFLNRAKTLWQKHKLLNTIWAISPLAMMFSIFICCRCVKMCLTVVKVDSVNITSMQHYNDTMTAIQYHPILLYVAHIDISTYQPRDNSGPPPPPLPSRPDQRAPPAVPNGRRVSESCIKTSIK